MQIETMNVTNEKVIADQNHQEICRLCGKPSPSYVSIFEENNLYIPEKISRCLPILVLSTDKLPSYICTYCLHNLNISYKLIITSLEVDSLLRQQLIELEKQDDKEIQQPAEPESIHKSKTTRSMTMKELRKRAIVGPVECEICDIKFEDIDAFDNHMETVHLLAFRCNLCDNSFKTSIEVVSHKKQYHNSNLVICKSCKQKKEPNNKLASEIEALKRHSALIQNTNEPQVRKINLVTEIETSEPTENTEINETNDESASLNNSKQKNNDVKKSKFSKQKKSTMFSCEVCKICFGDQHHFNAHTMIHEPKYIACLLCQIACYSIYDLFLHKRAAHNMYKKVQLKYVCDKCGKFFTNSWQWESHKGHDCSKKTSDNSCKYSKSACTTNHKLMRHLRVSTRNKELLPYCKNLNLH